MTNKINVKTIGGILVIGVIAALAFGWIQIPSDLFAAAPADGDDDGQTQIECGRASTTGINAFTGSWGEAGAKTEVYPVWTVISDGKTVGTADTGANSTSIATCDTITVYDTGATYYTDPVTYTANKMTDQVPDIETQAVVATTDLVITCTTDNGVTALTADDNASNTADYAGGSLGADEQYSYYCKQKVNVADKTWRLGAILTYYCGGEVDDFTLEDNAWKSTDVPNGDLDTAFTHYDDTNATTDCYIKRAYVPVSGDFVELHEWEDTGDLQFLIDTDDSTGPTANGDSYVGVVFVDYDHERNLAGDVVGGWYRANTASDPDDIGVSESVVSSGYNGLDVGVCIEPQ